MTTASDEEPPVSAPEVLRVLAWLLRVAVITVLLTGCRYPTSAPGRAAPSRTSADLQAAALIDARAFLDTYVDPDGRVVRRDQGGDTVSEGQAYALLLAVALGDRAAFSRVLSWTDTHLRTGSALVGYHWAGGSLVDPTSAADADLEIAWALGLGGKRFGDPGLTARARHIASAVADREIGYDAQGRPTLAAGPWAVAGPAATIVEPGYWAVPAYRVLGALTGDRRWLDLPTSDRDHLKLLTDGGATLPSDWATVATGVTPTSSPGSTGGEPIVSGQDGLRALVWSACDPAQTSLRERWSAALRSTAGAAPLSRHLDGQPASADVSPLSAVAAAAVDSDAADRIRLLDLADHLARRFPTYYGSAWAALGRILLTTDLLADCGSSA